MAGNATKVRVAVSGAVFKGPTTAAAPTGTGGATTGFTDLGFFGEDGIEINLPDSGDANPIRAHDGTVVRVIRTPSEDSPTWSLVLIETSVAVVETYFGVTVTQTITEGSFEYSVTTRGHNSYIVDAIDGAELIRDYIPHGLVSEVEAITQANGEPIGYGVTIAAERDPELGYNFKRWATALKS